MAGKQEQGNDVYLVRVNWPDEQNRGEPQSREVWSCGLFSNEDGVKQKVEQLNATERGTFGEHSGFFYDWCIYTFLSSGDIPY